jgi:hypothetical protein
MFVHPPSLYFCGDARNARSWLGKGRAATRWKLRRSTAIWPAPKRRQNGRRACGRECRHASSRQESCNKLFRVSDQAPARALSSHPCPFAVVHAALFETEAMFLSLAPSCHRLLRPCAVRSSASPAALALLLAAPAAADPTGRVGRIAWLSGSVHLHRADSGESTNALLNWPITSGDILSTAAGARSEVQLGSTSVQFDSSSILEFVAVDDQRVRLRLLAGSVIIRLRSPEAAAEFELSSRDGSFSFPEAGSYRFDAEPAATVATVHGGSLRFAASDGALDLRAGQRAQLWNDGGIRYQVSAPVEDAFVLWSAAREQGPASAAYGRYVSPEMTGAADLDAHGRWYDSPEYGAVWFPQAVAADWAPYRHGRWMWVAPWGWTWVGDEPWGFAPFPLRPLGVPRRCLGLGARQACGATGVRTGAGRLGRLAGRQCLGTGRRAPRRRLVSPRATRSLCAALPVQRKTCPCGQRHPCHPDQQHHDDHQQSAGGGRAHALRASANAARGDHGAGRCRRPAAADRSRRDAAARRQVTWRSVGAGAGAGCSTAGRSRAGRRRASTDGAGWP